MTTATPAVKLITPKGYQDDMAITTFPKSRLQYTRKHGGGNVPNRSVIDSRYVTMRLFVRLVVQGSTRHTHPHPEYQEGRKAHNLL